MKKYLLSAILAGLSFLPLAGFAGGDVDQFNSRLQIVNTTNTTANAVFVNSYCFGVPTFAQTQYKHAYGIPYNLFKSSIPGICNDGKNYSTIVGFKHFDAGNEDTSAYEFIFDLVNGQPSVKTIREVSAGKLKVIHESKYGLDFIYIFEKV